MIVVVRLKYLTCHSAKSIVWVIVFGTEATEMVVHDRGWLVTELWVFSLSCEVLNDRVRYECFAKTHFCYTLLVFGGFPRD